MTESILISAFPKSSVIECFRHWDEASGYAQINTPERIAMFFAQVGHECQGFTVFEENLYYKAQGLANTWPKRYAVNPKSKVKVPNALALSIEKKPQIIANYTYANRMGNGNSASGDGWKYRGRGAIMTTGKENYINFDKRFSLKGELVKNPDLLKEPYWSMMSAAYYWKVKNVNSFADAKNVSGARKAINGGLIGLEEVQNIYTMLIH